jgi:hypothetical protein
MFKITIAKVNAETAVKTTGPEVIIEPFKVENGIDADTPINAETAVN